MLARRAPSLGLVIGMLALACTPVSSPELELEIPDDPAGIDPSEPPDDVIAEALDEPEVPVIADEAGDLPTARCVPTSGQQEATEVGDPTDPGGGRLLTKLADGRVMGLPLRHTSFDVMVVGTVAETTVTQRFENSLSDTIEVVYTFPLPHDGAVDDYTLRVGERVARGELHRRAKAKEIYDEAKEAGHTAGLLEQERPNVFTQRVANVAPGEAVEVSMHVVQPLRPERGTYELALPTVVGPRYVPGTPTGTHVGTGMIADTDAVPDASKITPPVLPEGLRSCGDLEIEVSIDAGGPLTALRTKSHRVTVEPDHLGALVRLDDRFARLDRDFVLSWRRDGDEPTATLQAQPDDDGDGGYFTLTVQPPLVIDPDDVPARELVFVVDASGSMMGAPMDVAKATMQRFIGGLRPDDAFQVLRFSDHASGLGTELLSPTDENVERALAYIDALEGEGGTSMLEGIRAALDMPRSGDGAARKLRYVVFLTDGYIGNESEVFELVGERIGDARLFSLGVGSSVNRYLLDGLARMGKGAVTYVDLSEPTEPVVERIYDKLRQPALVDLDVEIEGLPVRSMVPGTLPDLFVGEPVVLFGRYEGQLRGTAVVRGRRGDETVELPVAMRAVRDEDVDGVRSMWARERIDELELDPALSWASAARRAKVEAQVTELSLRHRVLTQHTAFVAVERTRVVSGSSKGKTVVQGVELPAGVAHEAVWGHIGAPPKGRSLVGSGSGGGSGSGYGAGSGAGFGGRGNRVPQIRHAKAEIHGSLDRAIIRRIVRAHVNEVRHCYNRGLVMDPTLAGRVVIEFVIGATGEGQRVGGLEQRPRRRGGGRVHRRCGEALDVPPHGRSYGAGALPVPALPRVRPARRRGGAAGRAHGVGSAVVAAAPGPPAAVVIVVVDRVEEFLRVGAATRDLAVEHLAALVEDVDRVQRELGLVGVGDPKAQDQLLLRVGGERHGEALLLGPRQGVGRDVDADRHDAHAALVEFGEVGLQIADLLVAGGSPEAAVEEQQHRPRAAGLGERERAAVGERELEVGIVSPSVGAVGAPPNAP